MQPELSDAFKANPFFFTVSTGLAVCAGVLALLALVLVVKKPKLTLVVAVLAIVGSLGAFGFGLLGRTLAVSRVDGAASYPGLTDADRERITTGGYAEARVCLVHGAMVSVLPFLAGIAGLGMGIVRYRKSRG